jgi:membrane protein implicated in regulation of membrane protease activity
LGVAVGLPGQPYAEWGLFIVLAIVLMFGVRRQLYGRLVGSPPPMFETVVGEVATVSESIEPGAMGRVRLRGTDWTARNVGRITLHEGQRAKIERVENLVVDLRAEEE